jgi:hypothetical protein
VFFGAVDKKGKFSKASLIDMTHIRKWFSERIDRGTASVPGFIAAFRIDYRHLLALSICTVVMTGVSMAQTQRDCDLKFEYEVTDTSEGRKNGTIHIRRIEGTGPFTIRLYDLLAGKREFEDTRQLESMPYNERVKVFENVGPGIYLIRVENAMCSRSLSGMEGIAVK